jgi:glycosyltransferase involved in cell wall biosynthesis
MRIGIYTSDLMPQNQHLMPWRAVLEIGKAACAAGHPARVLSGRRCPAATRWAYGDCPVEEITKPYSRGTIDNLQRLIRRERFDVLFWPVAWCSARRQGRVLATSTPIVWYVPGACYLLRQAVRAIPDVGVRSSLSFVLQSVYPKRHLVTKLRHPMASLMITASPFSRRIVCRAGWPAEDVFAVPPGKAAVHPSANGDAPIVFNTIRRRLAERPFYLFLGPPTGIRGIKPLLRAFDRLARQRPEVCLVCLFRSDSQTDVARLRRSVQGGSFSDRIVCVWQSVGRADLDAFLEACHAVVLPFLLVPSEIPLAVIEAAGHRKPVITTGPGGTADFVREFGLAVPPGRSKPLAEAMLRLLDDKTLYIEKCGAAERIYAAHPTWDEVTRLWLMVAEKALRRGELVHEGYTCGCDAIHCYQWN